MRFLADENISALVIRRLRSDRHDVASIAETSSGISDQQVLQIAQDSDRILITEDRDFGELIIRQRLPVRALLLLALDPLSAFAEADKVSSLVAEHGDRFDGHIVVVEPSRIRIRPLKGPL